MLILSNPYLQTFKSVAELGTAHAAAKALHVTQASITQRIQSLERELAITLFIRSRRGMALTEEGKALLQFCRSNQELTGHFLSKIRGDAREEVALTIVGPTSALSTRVAEAIRPLYSRYPFLRM